MYLIYGYNRKTFWGSQEYIEDRNNFAELADIKKAFAALKKDHTAAVKFDRGNVAVSICYDNYSDFERGILSVHVFTRPNTNVCFEASYSAMRRACINLFTGAAETITF